MTSPTLLYRVASTVAPSDVSECDIQAPNVKLRQTSQEPEIIADVKPFSEAARADLRTSFLLEQVRMIGEQAFWGNNCLTECNKRQGWKLNILAQPAAVGDEVYGFVIYKVDVKQRILQIQYIAVADKHRRHGVGSMLLKALQKFATKILTKSTVDKIACACVPEAVGFYQKHNFRKCRRIVPDEHEREVVHADGTIEKQIPLQFHMEWKVPDKIRR